LPVIDSPSDRRIVYFSVFCLLAISVAGLAFRYALSPRLEVFGAISLFAAALANAATAVVLLETWRHSQRRRATFVLVLSFGVNAILALFAMLSLPPLPGAPSVLPVYARSGPWLYTIWHVAAALGGLAYIASRLRDRTGAMGRASIVTDVALAGSLVSAVVLLVFAFGNQLPALVVGASVRATISHGIGTLEVVLLASATALAFGLRRPTMIDQTLAVSLLTLTLEVTVMFVGGRLSGPAFDASRLLLLFGSLLVFASAIAALIASRSKLTEVETTLRLVTGQATVRAERIRALWQMASESSSPKSERFRRMLGDAAATIRPGKSMFGGLSHVEGDTVVVDATSFTATKAAADVFTARVYPGARFALRDSILSLLTLEGGTQVWNDLSVIDGKLISKELGWKSLIGTPVQSGGRTYFVTFGSVDLMTDQPYAEDDIAYVEVVASFLVGHANQQVQFEQIQFDIEHDALTGLENRAQFHNAIRNEIAAGRTFQIAFVNLDGFRRVNERDGHQLGDRVLCQIASALRAVASGNAVARVSADEFGILLRGIDSPDAIRDVFERYANVFVEPVRLDDRGEIRMLGIAASIGTARFPADGDSLEELVRRASVALRVAKRRGGSQTMHFESAMEAIAEESQLRYVELSEAIAGDQLALVYQPTFDLASRKAVGAEALVRWDHPERGRLSPADFVDFAERNGLMGALSRWVLDRVVRDITRDDVSFATGFRVFFNLGAQMLADVPFIAYLKDVLRRAPHAAVHLGVEVTETAAMENVERSMDTIDLFRRWGLHIAIDDFGTGHSSLSYLKQLTVDVVKVDRSFVMGLPDDERDTLLTDMLLRISESFGYATVAEGIETEGQAAWLLAHGCGFGQGYLVAPPGSFEDLLMRVDAERGEREAAALQSG
jgi:diguanylate cyclase (GGDEF)-like protein